MWPLRIRRLGCAIVLILALLLPVPARAHPAADPAFTYRLADTWGHVPWQPKAGRFGQTLDITAIPDGTILVLDGRQETVHVLEPDGRPRSLFTVPRIDLNDSDWRALRLDGAADGSFFLLVEGPFASDESEYRRYRIDHLWPDGRMIGSFEVTPQDGQPAVYRDIAVRSDGRVYLSRMDTDEPFFDWSGVMPTPAPPDSPLTRSVDVFEGERLRDRLPVSCQPDRLDLGPDGRLYVANRCPVPLSLPPDPDPGEPEPSRRRVPAQTTALPPTMPRAEGVAVFDPTQAYERFVPFINPEDLAAGPAGAFISRNVEIFALGEDQPLYAGPTTAINAAYLGRVVLNLEASADGRLLASINHCSAQGVLHIARPAERPAQARLSGELDQPELEGPASPRRLTAGAADLAVLQGRFSIYGPRPDHVYVEEPYAMERQTIQLWRLGAGAGQPRDRLRLQLGHCSSGPGRPARDVAYGAQDLFVLDPVKLQQRPQAELPGWTYWPAGRAEPDEQPFLTALAVDRGRVAALDIGRRRVTLLDEAGGRVLDEWLTPDAGALVDIAMTGGRIYLADTARARILVRGLAGEDLGDWPVADGPLSLAAGPEGDLYILGAAGWGLRYSPEGLLRALWPMPQRGVRVHDLSVDANGAVYVSWTRLLPFDEPEPQFGAFYQQIVDGGIWVFQAQRLPEAPAREAGACLAAPDKRASPALIQLGQAVEVQLDVAGDCPPGGPPSQTVLVIDSSRSMGFDSSWDTARAMLLDLLPQLGGAGAELALVSFGSGGSLLQPLTRDRDALRRALLEVEPGGDTQLSAGLELARQELDGPRGSRGARRGIVVITDGMVKDDPSALSLALRGAGISLFALLFTNSAFEWDQQDLFNSLVGVPSHLIIDPAAADVRSMLDAAQGQARPAGLFQRVTVEDLIPANMAYVPDSAQPPAAYDATRHALVWRLGAVTAADGLRLTYRLIPRECGLWPTNILATADYLDVLDHPGRLVFPVPQVNVICRPLTARAWLPFLGRAVCLRRARPADVVLVLDSSSSMAESAAAGAARTKLDAARDAATAFLDALALPSDRAAVVGFDGASRLLAPLSGDRAALDLALRGLEPHPGTRIDLGLAAAGAALDAGARPEALRVVVLLTDGLQNQEAAPDDAVVAAAADLRAGGAWVFAIALGDRVDLPLLGRITADRDRVYHSPTAAELAGIYRGVAAALDCAGEG